MLLLAAAVVLTALLCSDAQSQPSVVPANCNDVEKDAGLALDLINKHRREGYVFSLLRVANAHVQEAKNASILYLTLDVMETECPVLSRKHWTSCDGRRFFAITDFGQCKAIVYINQGLERERLYGYNCTVSPVPPQLYKCVDCPVRVTVIEDVDQHAGEAERILEEHKQKNNETSHFKVEKIQKVFKAVASRTGYVIEFIIKEDKCPRNASECEFLPDKYSRRGFCTGRVTYGTEEGGVAEVESCEIYDVPENTIIMAKYMGMDADVHLLVHHTDTLIITIIVVHTTTTVMGIDVAMDAHHVLTIITMTLKDPWATTIPLKNILTFLLDLITLLLPLVAQVINLLVKITHLHTIAAIIIALNVIMGMDVMGINMAMSAHHVPTIITMARKGPWATKIPLKTTKNILTFPLLLDLTTLLLPLVAHTIYLLVNIPHHHLVLHLLLVDIMIIHHHHHHLGRNARL
ncbi:histidine-rich glycoprotein-like [Tiliqua scincoides]|uniref:histidine-rich glycoprotein-like n=1 Tax=Tiliqua scincoides TaxID=71010 RepID=UPI003461D460